VTENQNFGARDRKLQLPAPPTFLTHSVKHGQTYSFHPSFELLIRWHQ